MPRLHYYGDSIFHIFLKLALSSRLLTLNRVIGKRNPENTPSWRLLERLLMRREGHFKKPAFFGKSNEGKPMWHDAYQYSILAEEFLSIE